MSSKKKSNRSDWCACQACQLLVTNKDWSKHLSDCAVRGGKGFTGTTAADGSFLNESTDSSLDSGKGRVEYGYIDNKVLHAVVCLPSEKGSEKLLPSSRRDLIHLNPETMHICGLHIGRPVILSNMLATGVPTIATAWPVANFPAASAGMPATTQESTNMSGGYLVCIESVKCPIIAAKAVKVICRDNADDSTFRSYLIGSLNGKLVLPGNSFYVNYLGKPCKLFVLSLTGIDDQEVCYDQSADVLLSGDLSIDQSEGQDLGTAAAVDKSKQACDKSDIRTQIGKSDVSSDLNSSRSESESGFSPASNLSKSLATSTPKRTNKSSSELGENIDRLSTSLQNLKFTNSPRTTASSSRKTRLEHPNMVFKLTLSTDLVLLTKLETGDAGDEKSSKNSEAVTYDMIGGLHRQMKTIRETLEVPLTNPDLFISLGVTPPRGVLLYGPPGVGKTMIARAVAHEAGAHVIIINGPEVMSKYYGESEAKLRSIFQEGLRNAPCLVFIDELDALCPKRDKVQSELEKRIVATLLTLMDGIGSMQSKGHLMVLGATNRPDAIDPALRRPGRFDREIEIGVPNAQERLDILQKCLLPIQHSLQPDDIQQIADAAHGYVGADLSAVCKEAAMHAFEQQKGSMSDSQLEGKVHVTFADLSWALQEVRPSAMREVEIDVPKVYWSDIGGMDSVKMKLKQAVEWPIKHPEAFKRMGITPPRGILMYGPPGCSKTLIAKALATESGLNFIAVKGPELFNKWVGESERAVREVFRKARMASPSIVFFDEIDALAVERGSASGGNNVGDRVLGQLLTEIDGVEGLQDVTVVAATNRPDIIDKALMRPGRLDRILYVSLPDALTRQEIFRIQFRRMPIHADVSLDDLVSGTENYSGAEVVAVCREAGLSAMQEDINIESVCNRHFEQALKVVKPRTSSEAIRYYEEYQQESGLFGI